MTRLSLTLIAQMDDSPLKSQLQSCAAQTPARSDFSIGHRGATTTYYANGMGL